MIEGYQIVIIYVTLALIWIYIVYNIISRYKKLARDTEKLKELVKAFVVFSMALMFDSIYWTFHALSLAGVIPSKISSYMASPEKVFIIKLTLVIAGIYLVLMLRKRKIEELARESREKKEIEILNYKLKETNKEILKFAHVIKGISECVFISDLKSNISFVNDAMIKALEYDGKELIGKSFLHIFPGKTCDNLDTIIKSVIIGRYEEELDVQKRNLEKFRASFSASIIKDENNTPIYIVGIFRDITQKKLWEEQMLQAQKLSALSELVLGFAHELNNPLTAIMGYAQILMMEPDLSEEIKNDIQTINRETIRSKGIIQKLMLFTKKQDAKNQLISINDVLDETIKLFNYEINSEKINLVKKFSSALPKISGDYHEFQQAFINIGTNAIQAMNEKGGELTIKTGCINNTVKVEISDTGPGIPSEDLNKIFDPFFTTRKVGEGAGLGLSVSYGIIKNHRGHIYVHSKTGEGTTFFVEFPGADEVGGE